MLHKTDLKDKERPKNHSKLKETENTWQQIVMCNLGLALKKKKAIKDIIEKIGIWIID